MITAAQSFTHIVAVEKKEQHQLVTNGIYRCVRSLQRKFATLSRLLMPSSFFQIQPTQTLPASIVRGVVLVGHGHAADAGEPHLLGELAALGFWTGLPWFPLTSSHPAAAFSLFASSPISLSLSLRVLGPAGVRFCYTQILRRPRGV